MKLKTTTIGRVFYGLALAGVSIHQFFYADFCPFLFPQWPTTFLGYRVLAVIFSFVMLIAGGAIVMGKNVRRTALGLGTLLLLLLILGQVPYEYIIIPYKKTHLGLWILPLKELALAGGAFCIAGAYPDDIGNTQAKPWWITISEKIIPYGPLFFCITMTSFGISHFLYAKTVIGMVPAWMPDPEFWSYFCGAALIAAGVAIAMKIREQLVAQLLGVMIFIWFVTLHVENAINNPLLQKGNEITAAFSALAFSGIAFVIAGNAWHNKTEEV